MKVSDWIESLRQTWDQDPSPVSFFHYCHSLLFAREIAQAEALLSQAQEKEEIKTASRYCRALFDRYKNLPPRQWQADYALGFDLGLRYPAISLPMPQWAGECLDQKHLLLVGDQGLGDQIRHSAILSRLVAMCATVSLYCHPKLVDLLRYNFPDLQILPLSDPASLPTERADYFAYLGDCHAILSPNKLSPQPCGFLSVRNQAIERWRQNRTDFSSSTHKWIGVAYMSSLKTQEREIHYVSAADCQPVFSLEKVGFLSLQPQDQRPADLPEDYPYFIDDALDSYNNIEDLAAAIAGLDLVISPSSNIADLAAALGIPVIRFQTGLDFANYPTETNSDSNNNPWYGTKTYMVYRTPTQDWSQVMDHVARIANQLLKVTE